LNVIMLWNALTGYFCCHLLSLYVRMYVRVLCVFTLRQEEKPGTDNIIVYHTYDTPATLLCGLSKALTFGLCCSMQVSML